MTSDLLTALTRAQILSDIREVVDKMIAQAAPRVLTGEILNTCVEGVIKI